MKALIFFLFRYWKKHLKSAAAFIFSGALLTTVVFTMLMSSREYCVRHYHQVFDRRGHYDILLANSNDELLSKITESNKNYDYGVINVYGDIEFMGNRFTYGVISDEHNILHIPLEEGHMPEAENEIALPRKVLDALYWTGKCGGTITLDEKEYTVTGIIDNDYVSERPVYDPLPRKFILFPYTERSPWKIPLIFVGKCSGTPLYRIDLIGNFFAADVTDEYIEEFTDNLMQFTHYVGFYGDTDCQEENWFALRYDAQILYARMHTQPTRFLMVIVWIGAAIAALSVYSVLRMVFIERRGSIETLKRIGMPKSGIFKMFVIECAGFAVIQTLIGLLAGLAAYEGILLFKTDVLGEKPYSAFTDLAIVFEKTSNPVLWACVVSVAVAAAAYLINALTAKGRIKAPNKNSKPRTLRRCFSAAFRQSKITVVQLAVLTLICFSSTMGYLYYTNNGKTGASWVAYIPQSTSYKVNSFDMEENHIAEYYNTSPPKVNTVGNMDNKPEKFFPLILDDYSAGFDDEIAARLPEGALITGELGQTFIASDEIYGYFDEIDLSNEVVRNTLLEFSDEGFQSFFDDGELGSKHMYRIFTKLAPSRAISALAESAEGKIDINALDSGKEIVLVYRGLRPPFGVGEYLTIYSASASESGYGIGGITSAEVKVAAVIQIPEVMGDAERYTILGEQRCNFLTTARGAKAMDFPGAAYTEAYCGEEIDGSVFPPSAQMTIQSLSQMKRSYVIDTLTRNSGIILILLLMSLLGFSGYFNGIGLKISQKKYEISVFRAVGMSMKDIRRRIFLDSLKIPAAAAVISYGISKLVQFVMKLAYDRMAFLADNMRNEAHDEILKLLENFFLDNVMWQVNAEIPSLILLIVLCAVTFMLTAAALKKFKGNIAEDINVGRTRE